MHISQQLTSVTRCRVHLHIHLDGSVRPSTIWELSRHKGLPLPGDGSLESLREELKIRQPTTLKHFLSKFGWITPPLIDDVEAIERMAREFIVDQAKQGVVHCEPRFCPGLLVSGTGRVTSHDVMRAVIRGLKQGCAFYPDVSAKIILTCIRGLPDTYRENLRLCQEFNDDVVGIDVAGDELTNVNRHGSVDDAALVDVFQEAGRLGVHRTAHAGEVGSAAMVKQAIDELHVDRVGHGYHVLEDPELYRRCVSSDVHFECCPWSSYLTGAVPLTQTKHPVQRFCEDGLNFSVSVDDPTVTQTSLSDEVALLNNMGFNEADICRATLNAARSVFLPDEDKKRLLRNIYRSYGFPDQA